MELQILPLAITMMAGPQTMSGIILVSHSRPIEMSLSFITGIAIATSAGLLATVGLAVVLDNEVALGRASDGGSTGSVVQYVLIALLLVAAVRTYLRRETAQPPKWLGTLMKADARKAFLTGVLLILLMPGDILVKLTVGTNLVHNGASWIEALPFIAATLLIAALPLLAYVLFRRRAERVMPSVRKWMTDNSWLVSIIVLAMFIALLLSS